MQSRICKRTPSKKLLLPCLSVGGSGPSSCSWAAPVPSLAMAPTEGNGKCWSSGYSAFLEEDEVVATLTRAGDGRANGAQLLFSSSAVSQDLFII